jgi:hypothetical protein
VPKQKWRVVVAKLGASQVLHESSVEANNWMSALRAARQAMAERPSVPPGASCSIDAQGIATVLDPSERRKFVLSPLGAAAAEAPATAPAAAPPVAQPAEPAPAPPSSNKKKKFQTVALIPDQPAAPRQAIPVAGPTGSQAAAHSSGMQPPWQRNVAGQAPHEQPAPAASQPTPAQAAPTQPADEPPKKKKRFETVGFMDAFSARREPSAPVAPASVQPPAVQPGSSQAPRRPDSGSLRPRIDLELLLERNDDPTPANPLCYRERAYLMPRGTTVPEAEASARWKLAELQKALEPQPRGKFVNLAVFDHSWQDVPERPPVITLQWRDWRGDVAVDYPAAARESSLPPPSRPQDDRIADVFEALEELPRLHTPADGLDFAVRLLERTIPSEAISACLYDINTDELRFVALAGAGAASMQGRAVPRTGGLFGLAARNENRASVFSDVLVEPAYDPDIDTRPGIVPRNMLLRPITHERQLLGMIQLLNREAATFSIEDVNATNYIAERLAEFLHATRNRRRPLA